ncbi:MAG: hypothetical protein IIB39_01105 [Candidatus Marinimicrobia bacterium]|nr:hypothetical protein [Candidatus Neomarinimicrobiota bacterium]
MIYKIIFVSALIIAPLSVSKGQYRRSEYGLKKAVIEVEKSTNIGNNRVLRYKLSTDIE